MWLYNIFIFPIISFLETVIHIFTPLLSLNSFLAIFYISLLINFLTHPIFEKVEDLCKKDDDDYKKLLPKIQSIKQNFAGQEQRMLLQTFFRQNNYHPILSHFRQSLAILLQVPVFIACYIVITSNPLFYIDWLEKLNTYNPINFLSIRLLPVLMTLINLLSMSIYIKGKCLTAKIYAFILPFIFLVLLYFSPASIVLFWTFNNIFSLLRNIWFYAKTKFMLSLCSIILLIVSVSLYSDFSFATLELLIFPIFCFFAYKFFKFILLHHLVDATLISFVFSTAYIIMGHFTYVDSVEIFYAYIIPFVVFIWAYFCYKRYIAHTNILHQTGIFIFTSLLMVIIFSFYLPLALVNSDLAEFYSVIDLEKLIWSEFEIGLGAFGVYPILVYSLFKKYRKPIFYTFLMLFFISLICFSFFTAPRDILMLTLKFEITNNFYYSEANILYELIFILLSILLATVLLHSKYQKFLYLFLISLGFTFLLNSMINYHHLNTEISILQKRQKDTSAFQTYFTSNGKNVLILFMDMAASGFIPYIEKDLPDFAQEFSGFTYYPYTVSFAAHTLYSTPSLLGGYEYLPQKLQTEKTRKMVDKHNEAVLVLPNLFMNNNWNVTLFDIPDVNYEDHTLPDIYAPKINNVNVDGLFVERDYETYNTILRNMFFYSIFRMTPKFWNNEIYDSGKYMKSENTLLTKSESNLANNYNIFRAFIDGISVSDNSSDHFIIMHSLLTHSKAYLTKDFQLPRKKDEEHKISDYFENPETIKAYQVNYLAYKMISDILKKLKQTGVYDNTKIIIVSDHAERYPDIKGITPKITQNNAVLLVKDFYSNEKYKYSYDFMTLADIPYLSTLGAIDVPINPFTNMLLSDDDKKDGVEIITTLFKKRSPLQYKDKDRTYLYEEDVIYRHIDKDNIKDLIKLNLEERNIDE